ncbi:hypothetical protein LAZ67_15003220 [Cordylochernes scorpioides]|uniref:Uncharacterized protein n=1 Tax=Cordylochernes scorpioides TaxID=51811 RepID=A0ABY6LC73_9ARAC|nr:hypothetical protein LAZ67_15003220 [Cordylochernes scorpioides]
MQELCATLPRFARKKVLFHSNNAFAHRLNVAAAKLFELEVINDVNGFFEDLKTSHFSEGIKKSEHLWTKCVELNEDFSMRNLIDIAQKPFDCGMSPGKLSRCQAEGGILLTRFASLLALVSMSCRDLLRQVILSTNCGDGFILSVTVVW